MPQKDGSLNKKLKSDDSKRTKTLTKRKTPFQTSQEKSQRHFCFSSFVPLSKENEKKIFSR